MSSIIDRNGSVHSAATGEFTGHVRTEADASLLGPGTDPLASQTPVEIDTQLADLCRQKERSGWDYAVRRLHLAAGDREGQAWGSRYRRWGMTLEECEERARTIAAEDQTYVGREATKALADVDGARAELARIGAEMQVLNAEFRRRGGWTRAFLVKNGDGHVHSSMECSTCNRGQNDTQFAWMIDYSAKTEDEIVEAAGWRACTVCYPSAPVGDQASLPTRMFTEEDLAAARAREERAAAKSARDAARIAKALTSDGSEFVVATSVEHARGPRKERFKTEQAATQWAVAHIVDRRWFYTNPYKELEADLQVADQAVQAIVDAIATKHGRAADEVRAELEQKAIAKAKRDGWVK